ncbi:MAG: hypothetical protein WCB68_19760 [Pyrinomonadaceae bacterium]
MSHLAKSLLLLLMISVVTAAQQSSGRSRLGQSKPTASQSKNPAAEQNQPLPKRPATVNLKDGATVTGQFIQADSVIIQFEVAGNVIKIKVDDVISIVFAQELTPKTSAAATLPPQNEAASAALRSLRKLAGATEVGISFQEYSSRLIDIKNEVDDSISRLPDGELKNELSLAMEAYVDAGQAWNKMLRNDFMLHTYEPGITLMRKYSMQPVELVPGNRSTLALPRNYVLSTIWSAARAHIERAASILNSGQSASSTSSPLAQKSAASGNAESPATPQPTLNVAGTWSVILTVGGQSSQTNFIITSDGDKFIGQFISSQGTTPVNNIEVNGNSIKAVLQDIVEGQRVNIDLSATIDGDKMTGTARVTAANGQWVLLPLTGNRLK